MNKIEKIVIDESSIYLEDYGHGKGKIIITEYNLNYSTYWGSMGSTLKEFLKRINGDYFANKLCSKLYSFDGKESVKNVRKYIRNELSYDLPWYKFMDGQKELRQKLKELESCCSEHEWVYSLPKIIDSLYCFDMNYDDEKEFKEILKFAFTEPWQFIGEKESLEFRRLKKLHKNLKDLL